MSAWRQAAIDRLPEFRALIQQAERPMALWVELFRHFEDAHDVNNDELIRRFYDYAAWCLSAPGEVHHLSDVGTAAVVAFYEALPTRPRIRANMHRWLSRDQFLGLESAFRHSLSDAEFAEFQKSFLASKPGYVRPSSI